MSAEFMFKLIVLITTVLTFNGASGAENPPTADKILWTSPWTYQCVEDTMDGPACQRHLFNASDADGEDRIPLASCILTCGRNGALWPYPTEVVLGQSLSSFTLDKITVEGVQAPSDLLTKRLKTAADITLKNIEKLVPNNEERWRNSPFECNCPDEAPTNNSVEIHLIVKGSDEKLTLETDESYTLTVNSTKNNTSEGSVTKVVVVITGQTYYGARHGLETLSQLIAFNEEINFLQIVNRAEIADRPSFKYRGLLVDTARNFIPIADLKKMVDALSYNKMNILHWHITDSNTFPFYSKRVPQMTRFGIVSPNKVYTPEEILDFLDYAQIRGVKVIPELDAPAHAGNGWNFGELEGLGELTLCLNVALPDYRSYCIQPPCGQLNPLNNNTLLVLGEVYKDFLDVFDTDVFHMGGDELSYKCWLAYPHIQQWLSSHSGDLMELWGQFQEQALGKLKEAGPNTTAIVWTSEMTNHGRRYLNSSDYIIQIWSTSNDEVIKEILNDDYRVIFSNNDTLYLDHGFGPWRGLNYNFTAAPLKSWQTLYGHDLLGIVERQVGVEGRDRMIKKGLILGGEATLWAEKADRHNMEMKAWPRSAAFAERLWSNPPVNQTRFAYPRLIHHRERMVGRGIRADTLLPESCYHTWGFCDNPN